MIDATLLFRQINPSWVQQGRVTSQAFKPTKKDERRLSVYDGAQVSAEESWEHFTELRGYSSIGVLAVSVGECHSVDLAVEPDPERFPAHVEVVFDEYSNNEAIAKAKLLKRFAQLRGWQYQADLEPQEGQST